MREDFQHLCQRLLVGSPTLDSFVGSVADGRAPVFAEQIHIDGFARGVGQVDPEISATSCSPRYSSSLRVIVNLLTILLLSFSNIIS